MPRHGANLASKPSGHGFPIQQLLKPCYAYRKYTTSPPEELSTSQLG